MNHEQLQAEAIRLAGEKDQLVYWLCRLLVEVETLEYTMVLWSLPEEAESARAYLAQLGIGAEYIKQIAGSRPK